MIDQIKGKSVSRGVIFWKSVLALAIASAAAGGTLATGAFVSRGADVATPTTSDLILVVLSWILIFVITALPVLFFELIAREWNWPRGFPEPIVGALVGLILFLILTPVVLLGGVFLEFALYVAPAIALAGAIGGFTYWWANRKLGNI